MVFEENEGEESMETDPEEIDLNEIGSEDSLETNQDKVDVNENKGNGQSLVQVEDVDELLGSDESCSNLFQGPSIVIDNAEDDSEKVGSIELTETPKVISKESRNNEDEFEHCNASESSWRKESFLEELSLFNKKKINDYKLSKLKRNTISKKKKVTCPECNKEMSSQSAIAKHLLTHRPKEEWPYSCILCGRKFQVNCFFLVKEKCYLIGFIHQFTIK